MYRIPASKISDGIEFCHYGALQLEEAGNAAAEARRYGVAVGLYILALEEVGKAKLLRDAYESRTGDQISINEKTEFKNHKAKLRAALDLLNDPDCGKFIIGAFSQDFSDDFSKDVPLTTDQRLELWFVDWDEKAQEFKRAATFDGQNVDRLRGCVRRAMSKVHALAMVK
jgi:AbiV family abortive infection protein